jgi:hypothetical protein
MKCDICKEKAGNTFLSKPLGTYLGPNKNRKFICQNCQKSNSIDEIKKKLNI